jgi:hypothetical protein
MSDHDPDAAHPEMNARPELRRGPFDPPVPAPLPELPVVEPPILEHAPEEPPHLEAHEGEHPVEGEAAEPAIAPSADAAGAPPPQEPPVSPPPVATPAPASAHKPSGGTPFGVTLLLTAALGGGIYYTWSHPKTGAVLPPATSFGAPGEDDKALDPLRQQVQALSGRVGALEKAPATTPPQAQPDAASADAVGAMTKQLSALATRLDDLAAKQAQLAARPAEGGAAAAPAASPDLSQLAPKSAIEALDQRIARLEQAPAQGASTPAPSGPDQSAALAALSERLDKIEQATGQARSADEAGRKAQETGAATLAALDSRLAKLEQGVGETQGAATGAARDATRAIRIEAAAAALQAGQPLGEVPDAPPALARFATVAPPTEAGLRAAFPKVAEAARAVAQPDVDNRSFLQRALARLQQTVVVREGDRVIVGNAAAGILARAEDQVTQGDLKGAADTLGALKGKAADAVKDWVAQVQALLDARAALAALAAHG